MAVLSRLLVALGLDATDYQKGLDQAESTTKTKLGNLGKTLGNVGQTATKLGTGLTAGVTMPIAGMAIMAVDAASDLDESMAKAGEVFGDTLDEVVAFSEGSAVALGQSQQQALEAAGTYGNLFTAMGVGEDASAEMSMGLVTLASDLASFNNSMPEEALLALRAGLTGETEPLKRFGVNMTAATIATKALELGLADTAVDMIKVEGLTLDLEKAEGKLAIMTQGASKDSVEYKEAQLAVAAARQKLNKVASAGVVDELAVREANLKVIESEEKLTAALEAHGEGSTKAQKAALALEKAQLKLSKVSEGGEVDSVAYKKASLDLAEAKKALGDITKGVTTDSIEYREQTQNVADIQNKLNMALEGTVQQLTPAQKAQAAYALIMDQTAVAQGDFVRTSDGLANSTRIAKAQLTDAAATMGSQLLPIGLEIVQFVSDLITKFSNLSPETQKTILIVLGLAAGLGPLLLMFGSLMSGIGAILPVIGGAAAAFGALNISMLPIILVIGLIAGAIALLYLAWTNNWGGIRDTLTEIWEGVIKPALEVLVTWIEETIPVALQFLSDIWNDTLLPAIEAVWEFIETYLVPLFKALANVVIALVKKELEFLAALWENVLKPALETVWDFIDKNILPIFLEIARVVGEVLGKKLEWLKDHVLDPVMGAFEGVGGAIQDVIGWLQNLADKIGNIQLPDWLQSDSPTPLEMGVRGISAAIRELSMSEIPKLEHAMAGLGDYSAVMGAGGDGGAGPGGDSYEIHNETAGAAALSWAIIEDRRRRRLNASMGG